nr:unnamed protein product [Callosobruchus chinensis]
MKGEMRLGPSTHCLINLVRMTQHSSITSKCRLNPLTNSIDESKIAFTQKY